MSSEALKLRADTARDEKRWSDAVQFYEQVLAMNPQQREVYLDLAFCLQQQKQYQAAIGVCQRALKLNPDFVEAVANLANLSRFLARDSDAVKYFEQAAAMDASASEIFNSLGGAYKTVGRLDDALRAYRRAEQLEPRAAIGSNILYAELFANPEDAENLRRLHVDWADRYAARLLNQFDFAKRDRTDSRRLRVGYVSPYFRNHAVNFFVLPILAAHDRNSVDVFCYSDVEAPDAITKQIQTSVNWRDCVGMPDEQLAARIDSDAIDILVDLTGHIARNRLLVFARKPAPITVTYIGYQFTTGLPNMDYRLTDAIADPPGQTERFYAEQLWRLPQSFFCYMPSASSPPITPLPADRNGFVTFGCQNNFAKISSRTLDAWGKILQHLPEARLLLLGPDDPLARQRVADALGDAMTRTEIIPWASRREYLARYTQIDIALDPIPFNGHTTTCDALWCGVPVVAQLGSQYVSRYGSSALLNLGLSELVASSDADYIEIAIKLASDRDRLRALRETLRARVSVSPICNAKEFTRHLEDAYRQMWKIYLAGRAAK